jgi:uncharacterized protein DUF5666
VGRNTIASAAALLALSAGAIAAPVSGAAAPHQKAGASAKSRTFSFYARVVRSSASGLVVRTAQGKTLAFSARQISHTKSPVTKRPKHQSKHKSRKGHKQSARAAVDTTISAGAVTINLVGLQPGATVLITETIGSDGNVTITITLPAPTQVGQESASGLVTDVEGDAFNVTTGDGSVLRFHMADDALSNLGLQSCDTVDVSYHQDAGMLIADSVKVTGGSTSGDCAPTYDATGTITQVSDSGLTISTDQGTMTFAVNSADVTSGFHSGDLVDVTYVKNADGTLTASDVQYVEEEASGIVTAVSANSVTITDGSSGQSETFTASPNGVQLNTHAFSGIRVNDQIDVCYHQSGGQLVADTVDDQTNDS